MSNNFTIARVYAKAIFDIAIEQNNIKQWQSIIKIFSKISQTDKIRSLCNSLINPKKLSEILILIYQDYQKEKLNLFSCHFIYIISKNKRVLLFPIIFKIFNDLNDIYIRSIQIEIISARQLNTNQLKKITEIMTHRLSKTINIICHINKNIIAGIIIRIGDTIIDGSLKNRILRLNNILQV